MRCGESSGSSLFSVMTRLRKLQIPSTKFLSSKFQIPSTKEVPSPKPQSAGMDGDHIARSLVWSLRFGASLELGIWCLELGCAPYSIENSEQLLKCSLEVPAMKFASCNLLNEQAK
jgi:hypothetical protein